MTPLKTNSEIPRRVTVETRHGSDVTDSRYRVSNQWALCVPTCLTQRHVAPFDVYGLRMLKATIWRMKLQRSLRALC